MDNKFEEEFLKALAEAKERLARDEYDEKAACEAACGEAQAESEPKRKSSMSACTLGVILGILSLIPLLPLSIAEGIAAIIIGAVQRKKHGRGTSAVILGSIGLVLSAAAIVLLVLFRAQVAELLSA